MGLMVRLFDKIADRFARVVADRVFDHDRFRRVVHDMDLLRNAEVTSIRKILDRLCDFNVTMDRLPTCVGEGIDGVYLINHMLVYVPTHEPEIFGAFVLNGANVVDPQVQALLCRTVREKQTVVDIGSGVGLYATLMTRIVGEEGHVHCFEAQAAFHEPFKKTLAANKFKNVVVHPMAVGDRSSAGKGGVPSTTSLDDCFPAKTEIQFVRIQASGAEEKIYAGMKRVIQDNENLRLLFQFDPEYVADHEEKIRDFLRRIDSENFAVGEVLDEGHLKAMDFKKGDAPLPAKILAVRK